MSASASLAVLQCALGWLSWSLLVGARPRPFAWCKSRGPNALI